MQATYIESKHECVCVSVCLCKRAAPANNVVCDPSTCCMHVCKDPASDLTASIPDVTERHRRGIIKHSLEPSTAWRQTNPSTHKYTNTPDIHTTALRPVHISLWNVWFCSVLSLGVMNEQDFLDFLSAASFTIHHSAKSSYASDRAIYQIQCRWDGVTYIYTWFNYI